MNALQRDLKRLVPMVEAAGAARVTADPPPAEAACSTPCGLAERPQRAVPDRR